MARLPNPLALVAGSTGTAAPPLIAGAYGVVAGSSAAATANRQALNALMRLAELLGTTVQLPCGPTSGILTTGVGDVIYIDQPIVMRYGAGLEGVGGTQQTQAKLWVTAGSNCSVLQYQRAMFAADGAAQTIAAYNASSFAYTTNYSLASAFCTSGGYYYACRLAYTSGATTPPNDPQHWQQLCPVNTTTFNNAGATLNQTPQNLVVTDGTQFGAYGGVMQVVVAGVASLFNYAGVVGNTVQGVTVPTGSVTIAGTENIYPQDCARTSKKNLVLHGGWPSNMSPGRFDPVDCYSSGAGGDYNLNVTVFGGTGDGWGMPTGTGGGAGGVNAPAGYSGQRTHIGCSSLYNMGTGKIAATDSFAAQDVSGGNGLGGHYVPTSSTQVFGKSWNNGRQPVWKANRNVADGVTNTTTTVTSATAAFVSGDIGNFIYDGATPGTGDIPAGTIILNVVSATQVTISKAATASHSGLTLNIGGYYAWPTVTSPNGAVTGAVSPNNGIFYVLKVASVTSNTAPESDSTNWQPIRTAYEWGWDVTEQGAGIGENIIVIDSQAAKFGAYNAVNSNGSLVDIVANGWISNPWAWNGNQGAVITTYVVPTNLQAAGLVNLGSSIGHTVRIAARQSVSSGSIGTLCQPGTATNCDVRIVSDSHYGTVVGTPITASTSLLVNGVTYGPVGPIAALTAGSWYPVILGSVNTNAPTADTGYAIPFTNPTSHAYTQIGTYVQTGVAGTVARFAIYNDNGGTPVGGALVWEAGADVAAATSTSPVTRTLAAGTFSTGYSSYTTLPAGTYWLCMMMHVSTTASLTKQAASAGPTQFYNGFTAGMGNPATSPWYGFVTNGTVGAANSAWPSTFPAATVNAAVFITSLLA